MELNQNTLLFDERAGGGYYIEPLQRWGFNPTETAIKVFDADREDDRECRVIQVKAPLSVRTTGDHWLPYEITTADGWEFEAKRVGDQYVAVGGLMHGKKLLSADELGQLLFDKGFIPKPFTEKTCSNEIFGTRACVFINVRSAKKRREVEEFMLANDLRFDAGYDPRSSTVCIDVKYFKGWHWDE